MVGCTLLVQSFTYFVNPQNAALQDWTIGTLSSILGVCLLVGFLTPISSALVSLGSLAAALSWLTTIARIPFAEKLVDLNVMVVALAITLLGPGAFSLDARLFGRREIIIPHTSGLSKD